MDQQLLFVIIFLFQKNWSTYLFQTVGSRKEKENHGYSTCNQLNGRTNSPVAAKQLHLVFSFNDNNVAAKSMISKLEYPHKM